MLVPRKGYLFPLPVGRAVRLRGREVGSLRRPLGVLLLLGPLL